MTYFRISKLKFKKNATRVRDLLDWVDSTTRGLCFLFWPGDRAAGDSDGVWTVDNTLGPLAFSLAKVTFEMEREIWFWSMTVTLLLTPFILENISKVWIFALAALGKNIKSIHKMEIRTGTLQWLRLGVAAWISQDSIGGGPGRSQLELRENHVGKNALAVLLRAQKSLCITHHQRA